MDTAHLIKYNLIYSNRSNNFKSQSYCKFVQDIVSCTICEQINVEKMSKEKSGQKLVHNIIKGSFHQGNLYIFDTQTAGCQYVPTCIVAAAYASVVPVSKWIGESLDCILHFGDTLYKS